MLKTINDEISDAKLVLDLSDAQMRLLPEEEGLAIFQAAEAHFVSSPGRRWWWEEFREASISLHFPEGDGWRHLSTLVPSADERVWFIAEDWSRPFYPVYEACVTDIQQVIGQCYPFEYYVIPKSFDWLLGESHHDSVFAIGENVSAALQKLGEQLCLPVRY